MLRKIRIILASVFFVCITLFFLDFTGTLHAWLGWMAKIQFLPAVLALNFGIVAGLLILTLLFGRVYCSVICPLGVMQDIISWIHGKTKKKNRFRFNYSPAKNVLRYGVLVLFIAGLALGAHSIAIMIAPYSAYGRIAGNLFAPIYQWANNGLAMIAERVDSYAFYSTEVWMKSLPTFVVAAVTFAVIFVLAWKNGRTWCNTICPVGTVLGFLSRFSIFAPAIDSEKCHSCGLCGRRCKSSCIDMQNHQIDLSRCVACMDCIETCKGGAVHLAYRYKKTAKAEKADAGKVDKNRRAFIVSSAIAMTAAASAKAQMLGGDGGLAPVSIPQRPERDIHPVPAGAKSIKNFNNHCTACQLCVSVCPNQVLRPSTDFDTLMLPQMSFERGYCRPECTLCSEVCPTGAICKVNRAEKSSIQIGIAVVNHDNCIVNTDNVSCGNCARHCPAHAVRMVRKDPSDENSLRIPAINENRCIGCGACENVCPARPLTAIHIEGFQTHKIK